jgi:heme-degrading monooxygenase HmoA
MIIALCRFRVNDGTQAAVIAGFVGRPRQVEHIAGFFGLEVYTDGREPGAFLLLTRWVDEATFRAWRASPEHHALHELMPPGLELDPPGTEIFVGTRIDGAGSGGADGDLLLDHAVPLAALLREGSSTHIVEVGGGGLIERASASFELVIGRKVVGVAVETLVAPAALEAFRAACAAPRQRAVVQFLGRDDAPFSLRCAVLFRTSGLVIVGETMWDHHRALEAQLHEINRELTTLTRESARQVRALDEAHRALRDAYWHIEKLAGVLPLCVQCRRVKTGKGDDAWETLDSYLSRSSSFLSHGYCTECVERLEAEDEAGKGKGGT